MLRDLNNGTICICKQCSDMLCCLKHLNRASLSAAMCPITNKNNSILMSGYFNNLQKMNGEHGLPAMRITALSAGSRTSPDADLERLILWCLGRFQGKVSPGEGTLAVSPSLSSGRLCSLSLSFHVAITFLREKLKKCV